jgi:DNA-directed RNA polymerase specialized sigma24 family protein
MSVQRQQAGESMAASPYAADIHRAAAPDAMAPTTVARSPELEVLNALNRLKDTDQVALRLIYWRGLTQGEVARELALPQETVRRCVARGMRELAEHLIDDSRQGPTAVTSPPGPGSFDALCDSQ